MDSTKIELWKLLVPAWISVFFLLGAVASSYLYLGGSGDWLLVSGGGYVAGGILWSIYKRSGNGGQDG